MGSLGAMDMADQTAEGHVSLNAALTWHLQSNHFPPHNYLMVGVAEKAIKAANNGAWDKRIKLFEGVSFRGRSYVTAAEAVEALHLDAWVNRDEED